MDPIDDGRLCGILPPELLEKYFFAGPPMPYKKPSASVIQAWSMAKQVCKLCPILNACRQSSAGEEFGVWGGIDQHERYLERRKRSRAILAMPWEQRKRYARMAYDLYCGHNGLSRPVVAVRMGITPPAVGKLAYAWRDHLAAVSDIVAPAPNRHGGVATQFEPAEVEQIAKLSESGLTSIAIAERYGRSASTIRKMLKDRAARLVPFPSGLPDGDGWVRYENAFYRGHYVGETADGKWIYMKFDPHFPLIKWMPAAAVELRVHVTPVVMDRVGRKDHGEREAKRKAA